MGALPPSQFAKVVARRRQGGFLQLPCSLGFRLAFSATGGARLPQFPKVVARRRQGGFLQLPCSLGFRLAFSATGGARLPQFPMVVARRRQGGILQLPCSLGFRLAFSATGGARLPQFAKVVARRRQGGFLQLPCSLGFRLAFSATGGARLRPPAAFEKSGGKPAGILLLISNRICRRAAHRERPARFVGWFWCGKGWRMDRMAGQKFQRFGRGGGRAQRAQSRSGGPWPPLLLWFCGPSGPAKRRRPGGHPCGILLPPGQQASVGRTAVARGRRMDGAVTGGGGVWRPWGGPQGRPTASQTKARGPGPKAPGPPLSGRFAPRRRPPRGATISTKAKKGNKKPGPMLTGAWPMKRCQERARQRRRSLGQSRCPCLTGSGGFIRPAAGYRRKPTAPASARLSPCA